MTIRLTLALAVTLTGIATVVTHQKRSEQVAVSAPPAVLPRTALSRASRGERRSPLRVKHPHLRSIRNGNHLADVTMYCPTGSRNASGRWPQLGDVAVLDRSIPFGARVRIDGNVYVVRDWIGSGSDFDLFGGSDADCEARALRFGRRHERVVVEQ